MSSAVLQCAESSQSFNSWILSCFIMDEFEKFHFLIMCAD